MALSLAIEGLDAGYGAVKALRGVTLHVEAGETVALLGTNGNGKSTLMKCLMGMLRPTRVGGWGRRAGAVGGQANAARIRWNALAMWLAQRQVASIRRCSRRPERVSRAATCRTR